MFRKKIYTHIQYTYILEKIKTISKTNVLHIQITFYFGDTVILDLERIY